MSQQETIRELWQNGKNETEISVILKIDRKTVRKYLKMEDFNESIKSHTVKQFSSKLDPYKEIINKKLEEQKDYFHKQKFTAQRMYTYLCNDLGHTELKTSYQLIGRFVTDNNNGYNLGPAHSGQTIIVEKTAWEIICYTLEGEKITKFERAYGSDIADTYDLESILNRISTKPNSWANSVVREHMADGAFKQYLDKAEYKDKRSALFMFALVSDEYGFGNATYALNKLTANGHVPTKDDARIFCERVISFPREIPDNPTNVSLAGFDALLGKVEGLHNGIMEMEQMLIFYLRLEQLLILIMYSSLIKNLMFQLKPYLWKRMPM